MIETVLALVATGAVIDGKVDIGTVSAIVLAILLAMQGVIHSSTARSQAQAVNRPDDLLAALQAIIMDASVSRENEALDQGRKIIDMLRDNERDMKDVKADLIDLKRARRASGSGGDFGG